MMMSFPFLKRQKLEHKEAMIDRISDLPDAVLTRILSFLQTQESFQTNLLSKRWRGLWTKVPCLCFDYHDFVDFLYDRRSLSSSFSEDSASILLEQFVYRVMLKYAADGTSISNFSLHCGSEEGTTYEESSHIASWISAALQFNVEELVVIHAIENIDLPAYNLPPTFFTCKTVKSLMFENVTFSKVPSSMHLPVLKKLSLKEALFQTSDNLTSFLMGCPNIHSLFLSNVVWTVVSRVNASHQRLHLSDLAEVTLDFDEDWLHGYTHCLTYYGHLLHAFPNVENLSLLSTMTMSCRGGSSSIEVPKFPNLRQLKVQTLNPTVLEMLFHWDKLESLVIIEDIQKGHPIWKEPVYVPDCVKSSLTTFCFKGFVVNKFFCEFVRYIMENAKVLLKMELHSQSTLLPEQKVDILTQLVNCKRASQACQVSFD